MKYFSIYHRKNVIDANLKSLFELTALTFNTSYKKSHNSQICIQNVKENHKSGLECYPFKQLIKFAQQALYTKCCTKRNYLNLSLSK